MISHFGIRLTKSQAIDDTLGWGLVILGMWYFMIKRPELEAKKSEQNSVIRTPAATAGVRA